MDKTDDGSSVSLSGSNVIISGSPGNVTYVWEEKDSSGWKALSAAPTNPGTYRVTVHVEGDKNHDAGSSLAAEFTIKKAEVPKDTTDSGSENGLYWQPG